MFFFTDPVKDALGLSRNRFSNAYLIGTIASALIIGKAGVWFNKYAARTVAFYAALTIGIVFFGGMYTETTVSSDGKPFYGIAMDGTIESYSYFNGSDDGLHFISI